MVKDVLEAQPLTLAEVKSTLSKRQRKAELSYIQRVTLEHTIKFSSFTASQSRSLVKKLMKFDMEKALAIQIIDASVTTADELASFLAKAPKLYSEEEIKQILEILEAAYAKAKAKQR
jgi:DNA-directed RNA polymerase subunit F